MKKTLILFPRLLLLLSFSLLMFRCSNDDPEETAYDRVQGSWGMTADNYSPAYDYLGNGQDVTDAFPLYDACEKDNLYVINANYVGELNEGASKCDPADPQNIPITWLLKSNNTVLNISINYQGLTIGQDFDILQLDASTMKLKTTFVESGVTYTNTQTFVRK
jgi:hypothetical protein